MKNKKNIEINDMSKEVLLDLMEELIAEDWVVYVKWNCEKCLERATSDTPNAFFTEGFFHSVKSDGERCGKISHPNKFGLMIMKDIK